MQPFILLYFSLFYTSFLHAMYDEHSTAHLRKHINDALEKNLSYGEFAGNAREFINSKADPNLSFVIEGADINLVHLAAGIGDRQAITFLYEAGADINRKNSLGMSPLLLTLLSDEYSAFELLLSLGANATARDGNNTTLLMHAAYLGRDKYLNKIISKDLLIDAADTNGQSALFYAVLAGQNKCTKKLIKAGVNVNIADKSSFTPLMWAAMLGHSEIVDMLLIKANVHMRDKYHNSALRHAINRGHDEIAITLAHKGALLY